MNSKIKKDVSVLMFGAVIAQLFQLLISPLLTRLYTPEQFGVLAVFVSCSSVLAAIVSGRYELAILLPKKETDAINLFFVVIIISIIICCCFSITFIFLGDSVNKIIEEKKIVEWLYWIPFMGLLLVLYQVHCNWLNRHRKYSIIAVSDFFLKLLTESFKLILGVAHVRFNGLVLGTFVGQIISLLYINYEARKKTSIKLRALNYEGMVRNIAIYKKFPMYTLPYGMIATFSTEFIVLAFTSVDLIAAAGFFALTRRLLIAPVGLLSASLGRVFYKEATELIHTPELEKLTGKIFIIIIQVFSPAFVFLFIWAPILFSYIFGLKWEEAGRYASCLSPMAFMFLFTSWPERIYEVANKQNVSFIIQLISDTARIGTVVFLLYNGVSAYDCILVYSIISVIYYLAYFIGIFFVAKFRLFLLKKIFIQIICYCFVSFGVIWTFKMIFSENLIFGCFFGGSVLIVYYSYILYYLRKKYIENRI
jgi:O-antigen/teichoic acid export membrane protein